MAWAISIIITTPGQGRQQLLLSRSDRLRLLWIYVLLLCWEVCTLACDHDIMAVVGTVPRHTLDYVLPVIRGLDKSVL